jgi:hypothetical protein
MAGTRHDDNYILIYFQFGGIFILNQSEKQIVLLVNKVSKYMDRSAQFKYREIRETIQCDTA